ncbi:hypothetical protein KY285_024991 [Solanum tuberosum]|nr:hypothetical protein KY289_025181 [Solanum tuberosum]KAH0677190.1 hypothetical protein KY285_024991 [Solanum tuberosum]
MFPHQSPVKKQLLLSRSLRIITNTIFKACKIAKKAKGLSETTSFSMRQRLRALQRKTQKA